MTLWKLGNSHVTAAETSRSGLPWFSLLFPLPNQSRLYTVEACRLNPYMGWLLLFFPVNQNEEPLPTSSTSLSGLCALYIRLRPFQYFICDFLSVKNKNKNNLVNVRVPGGTMGKAVTWEAVLPVPKRGNENVNLQQILADPLMIHMLTHKGLEISHEKQWSTL